MGLCPWPRTVCESVGERWRDEAGCVPTLGLRSHRCVHACWRGRSMGQIFDCREAEVGLCPWPRTVCESVGERWSDEAGCLPTLGLRSHRCLHACWRGRSMGQIFEHREAAASVSRLPRTVGVSVGQRWDDGVGSLPTLGLRHTDACTHVGATDFGFSTLKDSYRRTSSKCDRNTCRSRADMLSILDTTWSA